MKDGLQDNSIAMKMYRLCGYVASIQIVKPVTHKCLWVKFKFKAYLALDIYA